MTKYTQIYLLDANKQKVGRMDLIDLTKKDALKNYVEKNIKTIPEAKFVRLGGVDCYWSVDSILKSK